MLQITNPNSFDQLSIERAVHWLSRTGIRSPLTVERIKLWVKQFQTPEEKTLAWLILRNLIFRTNEQLSSSIRQALKQATIHFMEPLGLHRTIAWNDALQGQAGLTFYCGPPSILRMGQPSEPGKSGDVMARLVKRSYGIEKQFPSDIRVLQPDERFIVVDDGTYTGDQLKTFLENWEVDFRTGRVAVAVAMAHKTACENLEKTLPDVPLFFGELLTSDMCFEALATKWVDTGQWSYTRTPLEVYDEVHKRNQPFAKGDGRGGYGNIGALVAFEHGVPDDSIQLLWDISPSWKPLVER